MDRVRINELVTAGCIAQAMQFDKDKFAQASAGGGALELIGDAVMYAPVIEACAQALLAKYGEDASFPGVWDYEVSDPFGQWYVEEMLARSMPSEAQCREKIEQLVTEFWIQVYAMEVRECVRTALGLAMPARK